VITNGVDVERFGAVERRQAGPFTFALVGRLEPRKGVDLALSALSRVPGVRLEIAGGGADLARLKTRAGALGIGDRASFHGPLEDVRAVLAGADAILCSSRSEGLGLALLEGMATGLPVVGFAVGGVPETVVEGETGLLCSAGDVDGLVAAMRDAAAGRDRMRAMGVAARRRVVERFSLRAMCQGYAAVYAELRGR
jgi:glycosyltransferase involved in cell wall biosynthesis